MKDKIFVTYSRVDDDEFVIRGGYKGFDFKLKYLGFVLREGKSLFELTFYLDYDYNFEVSKSFEKEYVLNQFGNLDNFLTLELGKIIEEIEKKLKLKGVK